MFTVQALRADCSPSPRVPISIVRLPPLARPSAEASFIACWGARFALAAAKTGGPHTRLEILGLEVDLAPPSAPVSFRVRIPHRKRVNYSNTIREALSTHTLRPADAAKLAGGVYCTYY